MYRSTVPLPIGILLPTITFSVTPLRFSISPARDARAIVGTVISKAALASIQENIIIKNLVFSHSLSSKKY